MSLRVSGKNMDIGDSLRDVASSRVRQAVEKYFDGGFSGHVTIEREGSGFHTDCAIHLDTGATLQSHARAQDVHQSFEAAAHRIETRLRRYKRRLKGRTHQEKRETIPAQTYVIEPPGDEEEVHPDYSPAIIAEETTHLPTMTVADAVMEMDLVEATVVVFRNAGNGAINIVYKRRDGNIGWVDPSLGEVGGTAG